MHLTVTLDSETSERAGAGGMFQIESISDEEGNDLSEKVDQGTHYPNVEALEKDLKSIFGEDVTFEIEGYDD